jgi:hypothetical protein
MTEHIDQIEKFLKGQMSREEDSEFKVLLKRDSHLRSFAFIVAYMLRKQKTS